MKTELWTVGVSTDQRVYLETDDFTHDVRLYVNGDFENKDQEIKYASVLARKLNGTIGNV